MRLVRRLKPGERPFRSPVVTLGNFDGLHLGHRAIIERTVTLARVDGRDAVAFTLWPHPVAVLAPTRAQPLISSLARRLAGLRETGLAGVVVQRFTRAFAALSPEEFVHRVLLDALGASAVVVGYNVTFGRNRAGTPERLVELGRSLDLAVEIVGPVVESGTQVSSSAIRRLLAAGNVEAAARLLGRPHALIGRVRPGDRRGATIGFPTANVFPRGGMLPLEGVYAVRVGLDGERPARPGVANLGSNPTFGGVARRLEAHLFDFAGELYGRRIAVAFVKRLRGETRFPDADALIRQIRIDAEAARRALDVPP